MIKEEMRESEENFNLDAPALTNYLNMILQDLKNLNSWLSLENTREASIHQTIRALRALLLDMPAAPAFAC